VHARSLAEVAISSQLAAIAFYTQPVLEVRVRGWVDDSWKQIARAKKIFWKGRAKAENHLN
jgi:hypothetical protein